MSKPTLARIRYYQIHGRLPDKPKATPKPKAQPEPEKSPDWPKDTGSGWFQLSTGKKVRGEDKARAEQAKIDGES